MKLWPVFVALTIACWGAYVPMIHHGQQAFHKTNGSLRAFLFVGLAYFLIAVLVPSGLIAARMEPMELNRGGVSLSTLAGALGALGALGIILAMKTGGKPIFVAPLVFAGAPIINVIISMFWDRPAKPPSIGFYLGIAMAAAGAFLALYFKPK